MKIAILGGGNMGGAIALGAAASGIASPEDIAVSYPSPHIEKIVKEKNLQICFTTSNAQAIQNAETIILAVKPWMVEQVITEITPHINHETQLLASVAAGISLDQLTEFASINGKPTPALMRIMPNTAISIGSGVTFLCPRGTSGEQNKYMHTLFNAMGDVHFIEESELTPYMALASCGIAYAFKYIDAAVKGAEELGIERQTALNIVIETVKGAVKMLETNNSQPKDEITKVTTPGGITQKGLEAMEREGFSNAVIAGLFASK